MSEAPVMSNLEAVLSSIAVPKRFRSYWTHLLEEYEFDSQTMLQTRIKELHNLLDPVLHKLGFVHRASINESAVRAASLELASRSFTMLAEIVPAINVLYTNKHLGGTPSAVSKEIVTSDMRATSQAFDRPRFRFSDAVQFLVLVISDFCRKWKEVGDYYAPYLALVNASMTGKSRLLAEVSSQGVFPVIVCFRPEVSTSIRPPRTDPIADWACTPYADLVLYTRQCCAFFEQSLRSLLHFLVHRQPASSTLDDLAAQWKTEVMPTIWGDLRQEIDRLRTDTTWRDVIQDFTNEITQATDVIHHMKQRSIIPLARQVAAQLVRLTATLDMNKVHVLFVFDEARALLTKHVSSPDTVNFTAFRRAMRVLPDGGVGPLNVFCAVTDTVSSISNLAPPKNLEPSHRGREVKLGLFHPFVHVMFFDIWWQDAQALRVVSAAPLDTLRDQLLLNKPVLTQQPGNEDTKPFAACLSFRLLEDMELLSLLGRPGFYPLLGFRLDNCGTQAEKDSAKRDLIALLKEKLLCRTVASVATEALNETEVLALLGAIAAVEVSASSELATKLSAGHMRPVAGISSDRHLVYTLELSEPLLAQASHELIATGATSWAKIFEYFRAAELNTSTMQGFRGEVGTQMIFLMAWQKVIRDHLVIPQALSPATAAAGGRIPFVPVLHFLKALLGNAFTEFLATGGPLALQMTQELRSTYVRFHQFVKTFEYFSPKMLFAYMLRASAIYCRELQPAADMIAALVSTDSTDSEAAVTPAHVSAFQVQVKLWTSFFSETEVAACFEKMRVLHGQVAEAVGKSAKLPAVSLVVELGVQPDAESDSAEERPSKKKRIEKLQVTRDSQSGVFEIVVRGLSVNDVDPSAAEAQNAFNRMLQSVVDPTKIDTIPKEFREVVKSMFPTQPYMLEVRPKPWVNPTN